MNTTRIGDWIQTFTGVQFFPLDPRREDIRLEDIAHALSNLCRFGGHTNEFYSVAQHSVLVSWQTPEHPREALLHDATEAYLVDVPRPIKGHLAGYAEIEAHLAGCIGNRFGLVLNPLPADVKEQDERALMTEKRDLRGPSPAPWKVSAAPWADRIVPWEPRRAALTFMARARELGIR